MKLQGLFEVSGKSLGLVGFGEIGTEIARRAQAFQMDVSYTKRTRLRVGFDGAASLGGELQSLCPTSCHEQRRGRRGRSALHQRPTRSSRLNSWRLCVPRRCSSISRAGG